MLEPLSEEKREANFADLKRPALPSQLKLEKLNRITFSSRRISDEYAGLLVDVLKDRREGVTLEFSHCEISSEALELIIGSLTEMHHLLGLHIIHPKCQSSWMFGLEHGLANNTSLTSLRLYVPKMTDKQAKALGRGLKRNRSLDDLHLTTQTARQAKIVLRHLVGVVPPAEPNHLALGRVAIPKLNWLILACEDPWKGGFGDRFCRLLAQFLRERWRLKRVWIMPRIYACKTKNLADLVRATQRHGPNFECTLMRGSTRYSAKGVDAPHLESDRNLTLTPSALCAATAALRFRATPGSIPLHGDVMSVIASQLNVGRSGLPKRRVLRGLLGVNKASHAAAMAARSKAHADRLILRLNKPDAKKNSASVVDALMLLWRLQLAAVPLSATDQNRVIEAAKSITRWSEVRTRAIERGGGLLQDHAALVKKLKKTGSPQVEFAEELGRRTTAALTADHFTIA